MAVDYTFARLSPATVVDHEGIVRNCKIDEARFQGARRVENRADLSPTFNEISGGTVTTNLDNSWTVASIGAGSRAIVNFSMSVKVDAVYRATCKITNLTSDVPFQELTIGSGAGAALGIIDGTIFAHDGIWSARLKGLQEENVAVRFGIGTMTADTAIGSFTISDIQVEEVTGQSSQNPSEYVSNGLGEDHGCGKNVDGVKYFDYKNGNTVDEDGVVTEAKGAPLSDVAYLNEASATNQVTNSDDLTTWTAINGATIIDEETVDFNESSVSLIYLIGAEGNLVDKIFSAYVKGTPGDKIRIGITHGPFGEAIFTGITLSDEWVRYEVTLPTDDADPAPSLYIVNGDVVAKRIYCKHTQLEESSSASSFIPTGDAAVTRAADTLSYTGVNVHEDFVAGCDVTPVNEPEDPLAVRYYSSGTGSSNDIRAQSSTTWGIALVGAESSGLGFGSEVDHLVTDKQRHKLVHTAYQEGADVPGKIVLNGVIEYTKTQAGMTLNHTESNIMDVGNRMGADQLPCLYHSFQLFDQPLTDEQLAYLSKPGNNPKGCS